MRLTVGVIPIVELLAQETSSERNLELNLLAGNPEGNHASHFRLLWFFTNQ